MNDIKIFDYDNSNITFKTEGGVVFVNATEMAKPFGKQPYEFLRLSSTTRFLGVLSDTGKSRNVDNLIVTEKGGTIAGGATWMQEDVAMEFARWLSPAFCIWCNDKIKWAALNMIGNSALDSF